MFLNHILWFCVDPFLSLLVWITQIKENLLCDIHCPLLLLFLDSCLLVLPLDVKAEELASDKLILQEQSKCTRDLCNGNTSSSCGIYWYKILALLVNSSHMEGSGFFNYLNLCVNETHPNSCCGQGALKTDLGKSS